MPKSDIKFYCENCQYGTSKKSSYDDHLLSSKHKKAVKGNKPETHVNAVLSTLVCEKCQKQFNGRSGLWKHKKKCNTESVVDSNAVSIDKDQLIMLLIKQNADLIKETIEIKNIMKEVLNHFGQYSL